MPYPHRIHTVGAGLSNNQAQSDRSQIKTRPHGHLDIIEIDRSMEFIEFIDLY
jgi:hypothetical protein